MAIEDLTAAQRTAFVNALTSAFPAYDDLDFMFQLELNLPLAQVAAPGGMGKVALAAVQWAQASGELDQLLAAALNQRPKNPRLKALAFELLLNRAGAPSARLQALVAPHVPMQDPVSWRARMEILEGSICRLEMPVDQPAGSGFLIAGDLLLTNCHVADEMAARGASSGDSVARFGARLGLSGKVDEGEAIAFAPDWLVARSPVEELDFAVIRLAAESGRAPVQRPAQHDFRNGDVYLILQHPLGGEMKMSAGVFHSFHPATKRVSYTANTSPGSSGSPVFNIGWAPIALHHAGDSDANIGVVLTAVASDEAVRDCWEAVR